AAGSRRSGRESRLEALVIYLTTGTLPWELAQAETAALLEQFRETAAGELAAILSRAPDARASLSQRQAFFFRLLQLLPEERWRETAWHLSSRLPVAQAAALGSALEALAALAPEVRRRLAALALAVAGCEPMGEPARWVAEALGEARLEQGQKGQQRQQGPQGQKEPDIGTLFHLPPEAAAFFAPFRKPAPQGAQACSLGLQPQEGIVEDNPKPRRGAGSSVRSGACPRPFGASEEEAERLNLELKPQATCLSSLRDRSNLEASSEASAEAFPIAVRCAGLVLLHPFLPKLFETVGLLRDGEPDLPWAELSRAAALLHWLAAGRDEVLEFELGFVKVLLGRRPEEPLLVDGGRLTAADREEGEGLLQAAVQHWRALKGTTPAGLRASFLQRGGLLRDDDSGWRLQVEPAAFDLLLDHLPWGIGVIKLPWMTRPIFTEWPTP
ncbi:MAG TPA: contractile injection system tape measure protein, partial [Thermoanaerobaculia bacterium]|nr:contractile injection system tape measure protein [Thermoanaerobaculia bacterium]